MSDHDRTHESLEAYLAGGLTPDERTQIEAHIETCAECAQTMKDSRQLEQTMNEVFAKDRPDPRLEERAIAKLRKSRITRATALRFIGAAAAVLVLGLLGAALQAVAFSGQVRMDANGNALPKYRSYVTGPTDTVARNEMRELSDGVVLFDDSSSVGEKKREDAPITSNSMLAGDIDRLTTTYYHKEGRSERAANLDGKGAMFGFNAQGTLTPDPSDLKKVGAGINVRGNIDPNDLVNLTERPAGGTLGLGTGTMASYARNYNITYYELDKEITKASKKIQEAGRDQAQLFGDGALPGLKKQDDSVKQLDDTLKENLADERGRPLGRDPLPEPSPYFKPADTGKSEPTKTPPPPSERKEAPPNDAPAKKPEEGLKDAKKENEKAQPAPEPADRKIIRTGDIEFEIDSFDNAAAAVNRLIDAVKGGFVSTTHSDKLPNGKMKGSIVVRMPPQHLDKFILDLRRELGKVGDLRSQRIGSQDVTKQFTDTESELKAARVVADRLIEIMKTPKAEVKDLIAAEREMGTWRTKIEKMEGEIRYYKNQIALSTLTITLYEKEIQAPSALVITDHIEMRIEVEDVIAAHKSALQSLKDVNGRITKSEVKQHKAGQFEAILHAEVPPAQKDAFRNNIVKLGIPSKNDETQRQQAEGGTGKAPGLKPQVNDVQFEVALNNIVNIQPRQSVSLVVATLDVPGQFAKLKEAITNIANGQIRDAQITQKDRENVSAVIDFNVPTEQKAALDKLIAEAGPVLARTATQVAVTEVATERKFGFKLLLESASNVAPREKTALRIEAENVEDRMADMKAKVKAAKGRVLDEKSGQQPNGQTGAKLVFEVPLAAEDGLVAQFKASGKRVSYDTQRNTAVPENDLATAQITVVLVGVSPIMPEDESVLRVGLARSFMVFSWCVVAIITGLGAIVPVGVVVFVMYWLIRKLWPSGGVKANHETPKQETTKQ